MSDLKLASRRNFLKGTTAAAAGLTLSSLARSAHAAGSDKIKMALIGCGGRGNGAAENCLDGRREREDRGRGRRLRGPAKAPPTV